MHAGDFAEPTDLASQVPSSIQRHCGMAALLCVGAALAGLLPFARTPLPPSVGFVAMTGAAIAIVHLVTAVLLFGQLSLRRSRALGLLGLGYGFSALAAFGFTLFFPGVTGSRLAGSGQAAALLYLCWQALFPLFVIGYARADTQQVGPRLVPLGLALVALLALAVGYWAARLAPLPALLSGATFGAGFHWAAGAALALALAAAAAVRRRRPHMVLDVWLGAAMAVWVACVALSGVFSAQWFDLGFYAGQALGLAASLLLLAALAAENMALQARMGATFDQMIEARAREKSSALLASVLRQLPQGVFVLDCADDRLMANERAAGLAAEARHRQDTGAANDEAVFLSLVGDQASRVAGGASFKEEIVESAASGKRRVFAVSGAPVRDAYGAVAAAVVVLSDVTERDAADEALRHALGQTCALLENTPLAAVEWGGDQVVRMWSRRAEDLFGWSAHEMVGRRIDELGVVHADDLHKVHDMITELTGCGRSYIKIEHRNITRDGRILLCEWHNSVLYDEHGQVETMFSVALDVTERKQAMDQLRDADLRKDVFIATLAHELRNPLAPIANAASLLQGKQLAPERISWLASMIGRQGERMGHLLDDLLDVTRISRGKVELRRQVIDLCALVREALQTSAPLIEAGRHHLEVDLPAEAVWVDADPLRIAQVACNLVNNAAKYTRPGGHIVVRLAAHDGQAQVAVSDNGIGIEPDLLAHVFDPFVQAGSARDLAQGGLGIGLSLSRGLVELHGGSIAAASEGKDRGTVFTVSLPLALQRPATPDEPVARGPAPVLRQNILVADDNADAADSLALLLRARGAHVEVAHDGEQALQLFTASPADVAILDLGMPGIGGLEVARRLAHATPRPYLLALTGRGRQEDRVDSLRAGFDEHLTKPVGPQQLIELLQRILPPAAQLAGPAPGTC